jgi:hypothetical protein
MGMELSLRGVGIEEDGGLGGGGGVADVIPARRGGRGGRRTRVGEVSSLRDGGSQGGWLVVLFDRPTRWVWLSRFEGELVVVVVVLPWRSGQCIP